MSIHIKKSKIGSLHEALGIPKDENIPASQLQIKESDSPAIRKKKQFAINARKWEHSLGGQLLQAGVSFIPGVGQILAPIVGIADQQMDQQKLAEEQRKLNVPPIKITANPYGNFAKGGLLNDTFQQYNTGSHESGNDLIVDGQGQATPTGSNTVQNKENSFRVDNKQYVFSDTLGGKEKFNTQAMNINKKYPKARFELDQRQALDLEMKMLSKKNDAAKMQEEIKSQKQFAFGGPLLNSALTNASKYWKDNQYPIVGEDQVPAGGSMFTGNMQNLSMNVPAANSNMFVDNSRPALSIDPIRPLEVAPEYQGIEMATDTTQMPGGNALQITSGKDLSRPENNTSVTKPKPKVEERGGTSAANAVGLGLKGAALAGSIYDAMQPAEREKLILPDYKKSDAYMQSANIDYTQAKQDAIGVSNIGGNMNRSLAGNAAQFQGREQARLAQLQDALGRVSMQEGNAQSQLDLTKGQYESNKAIDTANRTYQNQQGNMQNQANTRYADRILSSDLASIGSEFNKYGETQKIIANNKELNQFQTNQQIQLLNSKYPNVKITPDIMEKIKQGMSIDEIIKISI